MIGNQVGVGGRGGGRSGVRALSTVIITLPSLSCRHDKFSFAQAASI